MQPNQPSLTALGAANLRAAHQVLEGGSILSDPLAFRILGSEAGRGLRLFVAARSRCAEDAIAAAVPRGLRQVVILGAGLDTYAYRTPFADRLRLFEIDHPATQAWKREQLARAGIAIPDGLVFAPIDFESSTLTEGLAAAGFDRNASAFFSWLGVVPYLAAETVLATLKGMADLPGGAQVVFDYPVARDVNAPRDGDDAHDALAIRVAHAGEPFKSAFVPETLVAQLSAFGFRSVENIGSGDLVARYLGTKRSTGSVSGAYVANAATSI